MGAFEPADAALLDEPSGETVMLNSGSAAATHPCASRPAVVIVVCRSNGWRG